MPSRPARDSLRPEVSELIPRRQAAAPVRSARAEASMSSSSVASSTMPPVFSRASMALSMDTGSPIWMAEAKVLAALMGL